MLFRIDTLSGVPIYQQIVDQVKRSTAAGTLNAGDRLPTVRELASELVVNPNTVARAYQDLERDGVVETRRGLGTFVCEPGTRLNERERRRIVGERIDQLLVEALHLNISPEEVGEILQERTGALQPSGATLVKTGRN